MILPQLIKGHLGILLSACGSWRKRSLKEMIAQADQRINLFLAKKTATLNLKIVLSPFIEAYENEGIAFKMISITAFLDVFKNASYKFYPSCVLAERILKAIFKTEQDATDQLKIQCLKTIIAMINSPTGMYYIHGTTIFHIIVFLTSLHRVSVSEDVRSKTAKTLSKIINHYINNYRKEIRYPKFKTIKKMAKFHTKLLVRNSVFIRDFAPNSDSSTVFDADLVLLIRSFTKKISAVEYNPNIIPTILQCCNSLYQILDHITAFSKTLDFAVVMRTDIHVSLLSLTLDTHPQLVEPTAKLIFICWNKYASVYLQGLNDLLNHGLIPALSSSLPEVIHRAFEVFSYLIRDPQFLVDAFVNYDCDHSGFFRNIFEQTVNLIVNNAYPNQSSLDHQVSALKTIVNVLSCLWKYFNEFDKNVSDSKNDDDQNLLDAKKAKDIMDHAFHLFQRSPKKGIQFFIDNNIISDHSPKAIADFLFDTPLLDAAGVGEILGGESYIDVLKNYVAHFDFKNLSFEQAFRQFLSKFVIPGEAQMIDRVMEQFGVKFYNDNMQLFSCADTVYVLSFSTLMLHTDAHHPNVKTRMTLDEFISNNKGIDGGKDLPFSFLESLYNNITSERIFVSPTRIGMPSSSLLTRQQLKALYQQQCKETLAFAINKTLPRTSSSFNINAKSNSSNIVGTDKVKHKFHRAKSPNLVGPMFHIIWGKVLGALTMAFEASDEPCVYRECIKGFELSMHIASHCYVEDALDTLVDSFAKFSRLRIQTSDGMKPKNFECSSALIHCAIQDHNYLKGVWSIVLGEISAMDKMREDLSIAKALIKAEQLFSETLSLDRESILDLIKAMCELARVELSESPPRCYTLIKFSDVSYYNMDRPMFIWKDIWTVIGNFLAYFGRSNDETIAATVVDIIRQLSRKFLMKKEINEFHFQQHFLQPFIDIFDGQNSTNVKRQILFCANQIVVELAEVLHSGWDVIFQLLTLASLDEHLKGKAFKMTETILTTYITSVVKEKVHLMFVLLSFVTNSTDDIDLSLSAVGKFSLVASIIEPSDHDGWECILQTLTKCTFNQSDQIKLCAEETLLSIIVNYGCMKNSFDEYMWNFFFEKIVKNLFMVKPGVQYMKNRLTLFKLIFDHLFFEYAQFFRRFSANILSTLLLCCKFPNRDVSFLALKYLCNFLGDDESLAAKFPDMNTFVTSLIDAVPDLIKFDAGSIMVVSVVEKTLSMCSSSSSSNVNNEKRNYIIQMLFKMCDECKGSAACAANRLLFKTLAADGDLEALVAFIRKPFEMYVTLEKNKLEKNEWNNAIVYFITEIEKMDDEMFERCIKEISDLTSKLIETDSNDVRTSLGTILRRRLIKP